MERQRVDYIDIAKGLGMLTIIWGHICYAGISYNIVYSFHIPLFFFLSGLVFTPKRYANFGVFLKRRLKGLLIPYFVFSTLTWLIWVIYTYAIHTKVDSYWMPLLQTLLAQGSAGYLVHNVPLWFVMCLFSVEVIYYFISKLKDWINVLICIVLCVMGVLSTKASFYDFSTLPWSVDVALMAIPFYAAGSLLVKHIPPQKIGHVVKKKALFCVGLFLVSAVVVYFGAKYNGSVSMGHAFLGRNPVLFYLTATFGVVGFMIICIAATSSFLRIFELVKWIGRNSFRVMALHNPIKGVVIIMVSGALHIDSSTVSSNILNSLLAFFITLIITLVIVSAIEWSLKKVLKRNTLIK